MSGHRKFSALHLLALGLLLLWLFAVFGSFYLVQKPFTPAVALAITNGALDLLAAGWLSLLGIGLGQRLLRWLFGPERSPLSTGETLILGGGLGLGALGLLTLGLGLAGLFYRWLFIVLSLGLTLLLWPDIMALRRRLRRWPAPEDRPGCLIAAYLMAIGLFTLMMALLPPTDWDGLFYHLTAPKLFIQAHRIAPGFDVPHFNFPFLAEMLFSYAMLWRGDIAAKLLHTVYGGLLAGLVYLTASRHLNRAAGWPAGLVLLSMPMMVTLAGWAYNDLSLAFYQLAALYALLNYQTLSHQGNVGQVGNLSYRTPNFLDSPLLNHEPIINQKWLILSGILAGLAMGLKYTGFVTPLLIGLWLIGRAMRNKPPAVSGRWSAVWFFIVPALLVALPWYLKNLFFTGNPFYPFLSGFFGGVFWDQFRAAWYAQAGTGIGFDLKTLAALPLLATLGVRDVNYFDGRTGPLFLAFLPLILGYGLFRYRTRTPERPPALDILLIFALAQFLFWTIGVIWSHSLWQSRLLLPALVALSPVIGWLWQDLTHLDRPGFSVYRFVCLLIGLALSLNLVELSLNFVQTTPLFYLTGSETRADYLTRRLGAYYATMEKLNETLPASAVVLFLWEPRSYFCQVDCRPDSILDQLAHDQFLYGSAEKIAAAWHQAGITHVLLHRQGLEFMQREDTQGLYRPMLEQLARLEAKDLEPVFDVAGVYQVYKLR